MLVGEIVAKMFDTWPRMQTTEYFYQNEEGYIVRKDIRPQCDEVYFQQFLVCEDQKTAKITYKDFLYYLKHRKC